MRKLDKERLDELYLQSMSDMTRTDIIERVLNFGQLAYQAGRIDMSRESNAEFDRVFRGLDSKGGFLES